MDLHFYNDPRKNGLNWGYQEEIDKAAEDEVVKTTKNCHACVGWSCYFSNPRRGLRD
jgi:hypothetical protein